MQSTSLAFAPSLRQTLIMSNQCFLAVVLAQHAWWRIETLKNIGINIDRIILFLPHYWWAFCQSDILLPWHCTTMWLLPSNLVAQWQHGLEISWRAYTEGEVHSFCSWYNSRIYFSLVLVLVLQGWIYSETESNVMLTLWMTVPDIVTLLLSHYIWNRRESLCPVLWSVSCFWCLTLFLSRFVKRRNLKLLHLC